MAHPLKILIVTASFYEDIADELAAGAIATLDAAQASYDVIDVAGAFEIPAAIGFAHQAGLNGTIDAYDGYIGLGCVIRGETSHYDYVCGESARGLMDLSVQKQIALVNGILTVENRDQAMARARQSEKNKGGDIAEALLGMIALKQQYGLS
jgi:6,7-dimethyl-8-ribityllumazine synthase